MIDIVVALIIGSFISDSEIVASTKPIVRNSEEFVVEETIVHRAHAHSEHEVATSKDRTGGRVLQLVVEHGEDEASEEDERSMTVITEHHSEEEGEGDDGERSGVGFSVRGDTVHVGDHLEGGGHFVRLEVSRRIQDDAANLVFHVIAVGRKSSCLEFGNTSLNVLLLFSRSPQEADEGTLAVSHLVETRKDGLLLDDEPFVNLEGADGVGSIGVRHSVVETVKVGLDSFFRSLEHVLRLLNVHLRLGDRLFHRTEFRHFDLRSVEGIADLLDTDFVLRVVVEDDEVSTSLDSFLLELVEVRGSHSARYSEQELLHALSLSSDTGSSDHGGATHAASFGSEESFLSSVLLINLSGGLLHSATEKTSEHFFSELVDLEAVSQLVESALDGRDVLVLVSHPLVCGESFLLNLVEEQVDGGLHFLLDLIDL